MKPLKKPQHDFFNDAVKLRNIADCLSKTLKSFEQELGCKNIELRTNISDQFAEADNDKIMQVFVNLISNALKYTPKDGVIEVTTSGDEDVVTISVKDNNIGISDEDLPFIFRTLLPRG